MVPERGAALYPVEVIEKAIKAWGSPRVVLISDQEPAMVAQTAAVQVERAGGNMWSYGPTFDSKSKSDTDQV